MGTLLVIPARGGSKGVPDKNIRDLGGKPLVHWAIMAAIASRATRVVVSTDDPAIADAVGDIAEILIRPPEYSLDDSPSEDALIHALNFIGSGFDKLLMVQCTSPMVKAEDINACIDALDEYDCCFTVQPTSALLWDERGSVNHNWRQRPMRQDRMQMEETGSIYAMRTEGFLKHRYRFFGDMAYHETAKGVDINDIEDFYMAEGLLRYEQD